MNEVWLPFEQALLQAFRTGSDVGPLLADAAQAIREQWN
jgi:hypothetical protein